MKKRQHPPHLNSLVFILLGLLSSCSNDTGEPVSYTENTLLISNISIVKASENVISPPKDILITGDRISAIAEGGTISPDGITQTLSGDDLFILPGLIDVHAHLGNGGIAPQSNKDKEEALTQFIRYGVTTVFIPGGGGGNDHNLAHWRAQCDQGGLVCPDIYGSGALITAPGSHPIGTIWNLPVDVHSDVIYDRGAVTVDAQTDIDSLIQSKLDLGVDAIKVIIEDWGGEVPRLSNESINEIVNASHKRGLKVVAHVSMPQHIEDGINSGVDGVMHSVEAKIPEQILNKMAQNQTFFVATLALYDGFFSRTFGELEEEAYAIAGVSKSALESLQEFKFSPFESPEIALSIKQVINENLLRAVEANVPIALGTDVNNPTVFPGYSVHEELALMVEAGLTPATAITAATEGGAHFLGLENNSGQIADGFKANLLILNQNPLENILHTRTIQQVILDGQIIEDVVSLPTHSDAAAQ